MYTAEAPELVSYTCNLAPGVIVPIPVSPLLEINILVVPLVSKASELLSFVPNKASVPKLFPFCRKAFVLLFKNDDVEANEAVPNKEPVIPFETVREFNEASEPLTTSFFQFGIV